MQLRLAFAASFVLALTLAYRAAGAQSVEPDSIVRVHVITLDSTWYLTGQLVSITGDSVAIRGEHDSSRVAFERIHVLSVERRVTSAGAGHSALVGCVAVGGGLGLLGLFGLASGSHSGGDGEDLAAALTVVLFVGGCALGAAVGAAAGAAHHYNWQAIAMPPRTGTEGTTSAARDRASGPRSRAPSRDAFAGELLDHAHPYHLA